MECNSVATSSFSFLCWIEAHPGLASWIQGVGSLAAILAAALIAWYQITKQARNAARDKAMQRLEMMETASTLERLCRFEADRLCLAANRAAEGNVTNLAPGLVPLAIEETALRSIPLHEIGRQDCVLSIARCLNLITQVRQLHGLLLNTHPDDTGKIAVAAHLAGEIQRLGPDMRVAMDKQIEELKNLAG